jgi:hypothetical protein
MFQCIGRAKEARRSGAAAAAKRGTAGASGSRRTARGGGEVQPVQWIVEEPEEDVASTWAIMLDIWPLEDRPPKMLDPRIVNKLSFDQVIKYKKNYEALMKREGKGEGVFGKDSTLPTKKFVAAEDNCVDLLHPAR